MAQKTQTGTLYQPRGMGWEGRWEGVSKGWDICVPIADSFRSLTENDKILKAIILQLKNK